MADEEVKTEDVKEVKAAEETKTEAKQEELPLADEGAEEKPAEVKAEEKKEPAKEEPPKSDWRDKELKRKHAQNMEAKRLLAEKDAEIERLKAFAEHNVQPAANQITERPRDNEGKFVSAETADQTRIEAAAKQMLAQQKYNDDCNKTAQTGEKRYKAEWKEAVSNLETLGGFDNDTMSGLLATDDPAKVLFELGKNPDEYHRIMELPVARRIIEMGKIAMPQTDTKKVSEAPAPVNPVGGRAAPSKTLLSDAQTDDEWYTIRLADKRKRWEKNHGVRR